MAKPKIAKLKIKTTWDLSVLYKDENDPKLERDLLEIERLQSDFERRFRGTDFTSTPEKLANVFNVLDNLLEKAEALRPLHYLHLRRDIDTSNQGLTALINKYSQRLTKSRNKTLFFRLAVSAIPASRHKEFLTHPDLAAYKYGLEVWFREGTFLLTEPEEKILSLKSLPSSELWVAGVQKQLSRQTIHWKNKEIPLSEAQNLLSKAPVVDRRKLQQRISAQLQTIADFSESEINAIYLDKKINDELRGHSKPYDSTVLNYENDSAVVENLIATVTAAFPISHSFYAVKAKLLGQKRLQYEDRAISIGKIKQSFDFSKAVAISRTAFNKIGTYYADTLDRYLANGQIDVFPAKSKRSGAYCSSAIGTIPTFVLLNHGSTFTSLSILAHEMGHAFHAELSKSQPLRYQSHTISVAEVASTFFENSVFDEVVETLSEKEKIIALHDHIQDDIQTIFRQIACFNFEKELHETIRAKGAASKEEIAALLNKHMKAYLGPVFNMRPTDGYQFVSWMHIRRFFYVYSYAYGQLISRALYARYKEDKSYLAKIEQFLKAGGSKSPEQIFKDIGIDVSKPDFWQSGLDRVKQDIIRLEKMIQ
jgi:oligoendopeptidase F